MDDGRFICTLHNLPVRLKTGGGRQTIVGKFQIEGTGGSLFAWSLENHAAKTELVTGHQLDEEYAASGAMLSQLSLDIQFCSISKTAFVDMAETEGYETERLQGDYSKSECHESSSPVMVWGLRKSSNRSSGRKNMLRR